MSGNYRTYQRRGLSIVWTAILLLVFLGFLGLGIDWGYVYLTSHQLQNAADASSLAGARYVREDLELARERTIEIAGQNMAAGEAVLLIDNPDNDPNGDIVVGCYVLDSTVAAENRFTPMGVDDCTTPNAVRTVPRRVEGHTAGPVRLFFGPIFGKPTANVARESIAMIGADNNPGTIVTDPSGPCALNMGGNTNLSIANGDLQVNSTDNCAMCANGSPTISAENINIVGDIECELSNANVIGNLNTGAPPIPDPLCPELGSSNCYHNPFETNMENWDWCLCAPEVPSIVSIVQGDVNDSGTSAERVNVSNSNSPVILQPGYYPQGIRVNGGQLTLLPGTYYIGRGGTSPAPNTGFVVNGGTVIGNEVTIYLEGTPDPTQLDTSTNSAFCNQSGAECYRGASFEVGANTNITLTPPPDGEFQYVTIFQAHNNTQQSSVSGGPGVNIEGIMYFPSTNQLSLVGGAGGEFSNLIITNRLHLSGNIVMSVQYTGLFHTENKNVFIVR